MPTRHVIGLVAGPAADGIDAALIEVEGRGLNLTARASHWLTEPYSRELRELVVRTSTPQQSDVRQISLANRVLGEGLAVAARQIADRASFSLHNVLCAGCLGHVAWHDGDSRLPSTFYIGAPACIAERTGLTVLGDFGTRDVACGGQGEPVAALPDYLLFKNSAETRVILRLGGLATATYLPAGGEASDVLAWVSGPCGVLLDSLAQEMSAAAERFDAGGKLAVQGRRIPELLARWTNHPFLLRRPPKSLHRSAFAEEFARQTAALARQQGWTFHDVLCTANHFVARTIGDGLRRHLAARLAPQRIVLTGGGVRNGLLWRLLEEYTAGAVTEHSDACGVPAEAHGAITAAVLACLTLDGVHGNLPASTGATGSRLLGSITPGSMSNWTRCLAWMMGQPDRVIEDN